MKNLPRYENCFVCGRANPLGLDVTFKTDGERVYAFVNFKKEYSGFKDRIHGGVVSGLIDEAMGWACTVKTKRMYFTVELTVKFKRAVEPEKSLIVEAVSVSEKHGICGAKGILKDEMGNVLVRAEGRYFPIDEATEKVIFTMLHHEPDDGLPVSREDF